MHYSIATRDVDVTATSVQTDNTVITSASHDTAAVNQSFAVCLNHYLGRLSIESVTVCIATILYHC